MIYVALDNIRSIHNVGSIFRTSSGAGVAKIFLLGITPTPHDLRITKTALGAEKEISWQQFLGLHDFINEMKRNNIFIVSVEQTNESVSIVNMPLVNLMSDLVFVFGNEITGVSDLILKNSDIIIDIPMLGNKNSLNVSVAAGVVLYYYVLCKCPNKSKTPE